MKYLKVFTDFAEDLECLSDAEVGRLFRAMLSYADDGTVPDFRGNEKFLWSGAKRNIDAQKVSYGNKVAGASAARNARSDIRANQNDNSDFNMKSTQDKDKDKDQDQDKDYDQENVTGKPPRTRFVPPSVEDVRLYCEERGNNVDPQHFVDYYTANGWTQGKGKPVKDWKACVRTWESNGITRNRTGSRRILTAAEAANAPATYIDMSDLDKLIGRI